MIPGSHDPMRRAIAHLFDDATAAREPVAIVRDGCDVVLCLDPVEHVTANGHDAFELLDRMWRGGYWVGALAYDLGRAVEPSAGRGGVRTRAHGDRACPDLAFTRFATRIVFAPSSSSSDLEDPSADTRSERVALGPMVSSMTRREHADACEAIHRHLRDGDCYQVNLTRRLTSERAVDPRALFAALARGNPAPHAALVELDGVALVGASPERFLRIDGDDVETSPIKGTDASPHALARSRKDLAEHVMIVDMARNDLGRVCRLGSVGVPRLTVIERHPGLAHMVSTVRGQLRDDAGLADVVRATFPPASITGAPKPRVMQIIDELEPVRRGYYCGTHGWIDGDARRADLAVTIRTFVVSREGTDLGVGGGVVADSTAANEWDESCLKAARLLCAAGAHEREDAMAGMPS